MLRPSSDRRKANLYTVRPLAAARKLPNLALGTIFRARGTGEAQRQRGGKMIENVRETIIQRLARHKNAVAGSAFVALATGFWTATESLHVSRPSNTFATAPMMDGARALRPDDSHEDSGSPLNEALRFGRECRAALTPVVDYTAVFTKTELIDGKLCTQVMDFKCRRRPFSVYLRNHRRGGNGREVIFVAGANEGNLLVHEGGLKSIIGTLKLPPDSPRVMETNRHPITDVGLDRLIELAMDKWKTDRREADPAQVEVTFFHDVKIGSAVCDQVQIKHLRQRSTIGYQIGRVSVDRETGLPVHAEVFGWPARQGEEPPLLERYVYTEIRTNVGLTSRDFDPENDEYQFVSR
ncbi:MAG: DUF1571 domain-containing protein [Planctomycetia bacterium]|nr:DUF1571 domain-containing protein [Planctomycetia bacterium]